MQNFIIDAWSFSQGSAKRIPSPTAIEENSWFHFQRDIAELKPWLLAQGLQPGLVEGVLAEDTRPRFQKLDEHTFLLILRGVNLNEGHAPDDMLSLRVLFFNNCLLTFRKKSFKAISQVREELQNGSGPESLSLLLCRIIKHLHHFADDLIDRTEEQIDEVQDRIDSPNTDNQRTLTRLHRRLLRLNRFLKPQVTAITELTNSQVVLLQHAETRVHFQNQRDVVSRLVEEIEALIDHVWVLREHSQHALSEKMNANAYTLSVVAGIFLPLSFVTGLLGVNVAGIPGAEAPWAFAYLCLALLGMGIIEYLLLRRLRLL